MPASRAASPSFHANTFAAGTHFIATGTDGKILKMSSSYLTDEGSSITRIRQAPHLSDEQKVLTYSRFQLDMDVGTVTSAPTVSLAVSDDGGKTFGSEINATAGASGETKARVVWRRLGKSRDRVFRVTQTSSEMVSYAAAYLEVAPGAGR